MLFHGWAKIRYGIGSIEAKMTAMGAPSWLAYAVYLGEVSRPAVLAGGSVGRACSAGDCAQYGRGCGAGAYQAVAAAAKQRRLDAGAAGFLLLSLR